MCFCGIFCGSALKRCSNVPMPTLEEIAKLSDVSRSTVSRVINHDPHVRPETRERVMRVVKRLNYRPNAAARGLAAGRTQILGLIIPAGVATALGDPYFLILMQGIASACNTHDYSVMLWLAEPEYEQRMIGQILNNGLLDGVIISSMYVPDQMITALIEAEFPFVMIGRHMTRTDINYVDVDNRGGAQEAVAHLLRLGYQRVATITGPLESNAGTDRYEGYVTAVRTRGFLLDPELIIEGDFTADSGYYAMQRLLHHKPEAVFIANDTMAQGALRALRETGIKVPDDLAIASFDDIPTAARTQPPLTTVRQPIERSGAVAVDTLLETIAHPNFSQHHIVLPTELVIRESCGALL